MFGKQHITFDKHGRAQAGKWGERRRVREIVMPGGGLDARLSAGPRHRRQGLCGHFARREPAQIHALGKLVRLRWGTDCRGSCWGPAACIF